MALCIGHFRVKHGLQTFFTLISALPCRKRNSRLRHPRLLVLVRLRLVTQPTCNSLTVSSIRSRRLTYQPSRLRLRPSTATCLTWNSAAAQKAWNGLKRQHTGGVVPLLQLIPVAHSGPATICSSLLATRLTRGQRRFLCR